MTQKMEVYKCEVCGNIIEMVHQGAGELVCCNQPMKKMEEQMADFSKEKHVPIIKASEKGIKVIVGSVPHPMEEKHYIEWIEVIHDEYIHRKYLKPGALPEAEFSIPYKDTLKAREFCNVHGLWKNK
ncbi:MAG: desulfoferrodoxin [bacterium]